MPCFVLSDKTRVSESVTDKEILETLAELEACFEDGPLYEVEEKTVYHPRLFRKAIKNKHYQLYASTLRGEWQIIIIAGGPGAAGRQAVLAYMMGVITGMREKRGEYLQ